MKVGIFTITLNRLYYNCHCLKSLIENSGMEFEHVIVDNGSTDGSYEWLKEEGYSIIRNEENQGITVAATQGFEWLKNKGVDILIQMDSDCELVTPDTVKKIEEFFVLNAGQESPKKYVVSPIVRGLSNPSPIAVEESLGEFRLGRVSQMGAIFRAIMLKDYEEAINVVKPHNSVYGDDRVMSAYFSSNNYPMGYFLDYEVNHFETTKGQEKRYPEYFNKIYKY